jgi:hypothetical protein
MESDEEAQSKRRRIARNNTLTSIHSDLSAPDEDSQDDTEDIDIADDEVMGDDTMMKSMDMTIVSPNSLYSHIDSSRLTNVPQEVNPEPQPEATIPLSSPHVTFSSPLVAPTPAHLKQAQESAKSVSKGVHSPSRSNLKHHSRPTSISPPQPSRKLNPLPTPDSDVEMSDEDMFKPRKIIPTKWEQERLHVISQAQQASPEQVIELGDEAQPESDSEPEHEVGPDLVSESSGIDVNMWDEAANESGSAENSYISTRPSIAAFRAQRNSNPEPQLLPSVLKPDVTKAKPSASSEMSLLFSKFAASRSQPAEDSVIDSPDASKEDLSAFLRRKVAKVMDAVDFSFTTPGKKAAPVPSIETTTATATVPVNFGDSPTSATEIEDRFEPEPLTRSRSQYSPKRGSPLKNPIDFDSDSEVEDTEEPQESSPPPPSKRPSPSRSNSRRKSLLKITQERKARLSFLQSPPPLKHTTRTPNANHPDITAEPAPEPDSNGVMGKVFSYFFHQPSYQTPMSSSFPPARPTHPLLKHMRLLPCIHPWSDNHFQTLLSLYKHWQTHAHLYAPHLPENAALLTPQWQRYIDVEFSNWGFDLLLTPSLIVLAALFGQLLQLADATEYRALYGEDLEMGWLASRTLTDGAITEWHIVLRLFTVAVGDVVREEEKDGKPVDRTPALKWRFRGQWLWKRGWYWGLL